MQGSKTIAILLSTPSFEDFYGRGMGLTLEAYLSTYRNDFSWYYCDMFVKYGWKPIIYMASNTHSGIYQVENGIQVRMLPLTPWFSAIQKLPIWRTKLGRYAHESLNAIGFRKSLHSALTADKVDILYVQEYWTGRFDRIVSWFKGKTRPLIIGADHGGQKNHHLLWFKKAAFKQCAMLQSQTSAEAEEVKAFGTTPVVLGNPVDIEFFQPANSAAVSPGALKSVITVARFNNNQKRTTDLIEAFRFLDDTWRLDIYGKGPDEPLLRETIAKFDLGSKVSLKGFLANRDALRTIYQASTVFSLPSFNEGIPMVVLEAMSCAMPVVVTNIRAFESLIDDRVSGIKVPVGDPAAIASALQEAHANSAALGAAARDRVADRHSFAHFMRMFVAGLGEQTTR